MKKLGILIPSRDNWAADFGMSMTHAAMRFLAQGSASGEQWQLSIRNRLGSCICSNRAEMVLQALIDGCTHILFVDDDMSFPEDTFCRLVDADKDIIAANCVTKELPPLSTASDEKLNRIFTLPSSTGLQEVHTVGTGIMLIKREVFEKVPKPWFIEEWDEKAGHFTGEDRTFCKWARKLGFKVWIDHNLSKGVSHVGTFKYAHNMTKPWIAEEDGIDRAAQIPDERGVRTARR